MKKKTYQISKRLTGFSTCFRQWNNATSHCRFLHGYDLIFVLVFEAQTLDHHHWVWDFGWMKDPRYNIDGMAVKAWFDYMFDHSVIIAADDPELETFKLLATKGLIQLRIIPQYSTEKVAELIMHKLQPLVSQHSNRRVVVKRVEVWENDNNMGAVITNEN